MEQEQDDTTDVPGGIHTNDGVTPEIHSSKETITVEMHTGEETAAEMHTGEETVAEIHTSEETIAEMHTGEETAAGEVHSSEETATGRVITTEVPPNEDILADSVNESGAETVPAAVQQEIVIATERGGGDCQSIVTGNFYYAWERLDLEISINFSLEK